MIAHFPCLSYISVYGNSSYNHARYDHTPGPGSFSNMNLVSINYHVGSTKTQLLSTPEDLDNLYILSDFF